MLLNPSLVRLTGAVYKGKCLCMLVIKMEMLLPGERRCCLWKMFTKSRNCRRGGNTMKWFSTVIRTTTRAKFSCDPLMTLLIFWIQIQLTLSTRECQINGGFRYAYIIKCWCFRLVTTALLCTHGVGTQFVRWFAYLTLLQSHGYRNCANFAEPEWIVHQLYFNGNKRHESERKVEHRLKQVVVTSSRSRHIL